MYTARRSQGASLPWVPGLHSEFYIGGLWALHDPCDLHLSDSLDRESHNRGTVHRFPLSEVDNQGTRTEENGVQLREEIIKV